MYVLKCLSKTLNYYKGLWLKADSQRLMQQIHRLGTQSKIDATNTQTMYTVWIACDHSI